MSEHKPIHFPGQHANEHVVLFLRRHWSVPFAFISQFIIQIIIPPIVIGILIFLDQFTFEPGTLAYILTIEGLSLYYLFTALIYFHHFVDYHLDIWIITNERILSIEQNGLFNRVIAELHIMKVQDVSSEVKGKVQTFLNYGQVYIQTAGAIEKFSFEQVPHPDQVAKIILQLHDQAEAEQKALHYAQAQGLTHTPAPQPPRSA